MQCPYCFEFDITRLLAWFTSLIWELQAIRDDYYFQMYYDDLPIWGFIGKLEKEVVSSSPGDSHLKHYLFTHVHFDIAYNGQRIVEINVSTDPAQVVSFAEVLLYSSICIMYQ